MGFVPQAVLKSFVKASEDYKNLQEILSREMQNQTDLTKLQWAASQANEAYLQLKKAQQLLDNYQGKTNAPKEKQIESRV